MLHETIALPAGDYAGAPTLTTYVQDTIESQGGRLRPAVVICPGGGYAMCSDREAEPLALAFMAAGFQAFVLDYRCVDATEEGELLPHALADLAHAVATVRSHADAWHVDAGAIAVLGCSAGGHLTACYPAAARDEAFAAQLGLAPADLAVWSLVLCYPVIDLSLGWPPDPAYVGRITTDERYVHPQHLVDAAWPRTFLWHTASDNVVPVANTYRMGEALAAAGVDHEAHVFHRGHHGLSLATAQVAKDADHRDLHVAAWFDLACAWLEEGWGATLR